jgi:hypothetical protein
MASGHVNRIKRPNTWLHRPMLQNVKKALANPEPSTHGTFRAWRDTRLTSAKGFRADIKSLSPVRTLGPPRLPAGKANTPAVTSVAAARA